MLPRLRCSGSSYRGAVELSERIFLQTSAVFSLPSQEEVARNHYQVLGVRRDATKKEIRNAFVTLSKRYHPDSNHERNSKSVHTNSRAFVAVTEAYHTLSNPKSRTEYDRELMVAETYRTQYEQRFYSTSDASQSSRPFTSSGRHDTYYSTGGGHSAHHYYNYDETEVDWEMYKKSIKRPNNSRVLYMLLALTFAVPTLFMFRVNHNYHKYYQSVAILESQRNTAAYMAVRERAKKISVQEQLDLLVARHAGRVKEEKNGPPNR